MVQIHYLRKSYRWELELKNSALFVFFLIAQVFFFLYRDKLMNLLCSAPLSFSVYESHYSSSKSLSFLVIYVTVIIQITAFMWFIWLFYSLYYYRLYWASQTTVKNNNMAYTVFLIYKCACSHLNRSSSIPTLTYKAQSKFLVPIQRVYSVN